MSAAAASVVYVLPDKLGGAFTATARLLAHRPRGAFDCHAVLTHNAGRRDARARDPLDADSTTVVDYALPEENLWAVVRRLARAIPSGPGVLVTGDLLDLATASAIDCGRAVVFLLHGSDEYYFDLAVRHERAIHAFVACSAYIAAGLRARLPHRRDAIHHIPHGVPLPRVVRQPRPGPIRAAFVGRLDVNKGVLDLPAIAASLQRRGVNTTWTIVGDGPLRSSLEREWNGADVRHLGAAPSTVVEDLYRDHDVFVLPTRSEGFPLALLEAMNAGVVPVVSDVPSGVPEIISDGVDGFRVPVGSIDPFAGAIAQLAGDGRRLDAMSAAARKTVADRFRIDRSVARHYELYRRYEELYRPLGADAALHYGSRLDRRWLPNPVVKAIRRLAHAS